MRKGHSKRVLRDWGISETAWVIVWYWGWKESDHWGCREFWVEIPCSELVAKLERNQWDLLQREWWDFARKQWLDVFEDNLECNLRMKHKDENWMCIF